MSGKIWLLKILETGWKKSVVVVNVSLITDLKSCFTSLTQKRFQESWENTNKLSFQKIYIFNLNSSADFPADTGRKLNVHKTFRRRPGRLLNVLCTFNLRPASTGFWKNLAQKATLKTKFNVNFRWILDINWKLSFEQISESCFKQINLLTETNP